MTFYHDVTVTNLVLVHRGSAEGSACITAGNACMQQSNPAFITKEEWPPNSPDLNPLDFCVWGIMLEKFRQFQPKPKTVVQLRAALQQIWDNLSQQTLKKAVLSTRERLQACVQAEGEHFEHLLH